jgi:tRNA G18 (ribose-2'-O)-methylase SpoU
MENIYIALENVRSLYNVGAIIRTCSFYGVPNLILVGYSGAVTLPNGKIVLHEKIKKTALEAEMDLSISFLATASDLINFAKTNGLNIVCIEQHANAKRLTGWIPKENQMVIFGNEVKGVSEELVEQANEVVEIYKTGFHNSLNVTTTAGIVINKISEHFNPK